MNYGLYLSASGVLTNLYRQDVFANNLANVETVGYKPDIPALTQRAAERVEDDLGMRFADPLLDRLGGGVFAGPQAIDFVPGAIEPTHNPLDAALTEKNAFFAVRHTDPQSGAVSVRLTRNGNFSRAADGTLVTQAGQPVLDPDDNPIVLPDGAAVAISRTGELVSGDRTIAQLQVARVGDLSVLKKAGQNLLAFEGADPRQIDQEPDVQGGALEASGSNPVTTLIDLINATKAATGSANLMRYFDTLMDRTVNTLGRVA